MYKQKTETFASLGFLLLGISLPHSYSLTDAEC